MLSIAEKILFLLAVVASLSAATWAASRIIAILRRGHGKPDWVKIPHRFLSTLLRVLSFQPVFRFRFLPSLFHALLGWGFLYFLLVNFGDLLEAFLPRFHFLGEGALGNLYRLGGDLLSAAVLTGMIALAIRRFILEPATLTARPHILLHPNARQGILHDSTIVNSFILLHVGSRFIGETLQIAASHPDAWQPLATYISPLWRSLSPAALSVGEHFTFWLALGSILAFIPYFLYSKHIHLIFAPLNHLLKPQRRSIGELSRLDFEDESIAQFGVLKLEELGWEQLMDAYACIMCYRCQQVCPAYTTGKILSPAALEINKRYYLNAQGAQFARGDSSPQTLLEVAIPPEAVWACTACGACIDICPVGNEPMRDIIDLRRALVLMENNFPDQLQTAFRGMERSLNPWNLPPAERMQWAEGLPVPTLSQNPDPELLWWVGCAPATDARLQKTARAFAQILAKAGLNFAVLGEQEQCTGDSARRAGNEYLFHELATSNVAILNEVAPKRIVTTCPHCLHTLKNEYPAFGGNYQVIHHSQLIDELLASGKLKLKQPPASHAQPPEPNYPIQSITYHDPCYLGRHNQILNAPRQVLKRTTTLVEMPRHGKKSFCCGAGGAQMWKEEEPGDQRVNANRFEEAAATGAEALAVGCPFCMIMLSDAAKASPNPIPVLDIAELLLPSLA